MSDTSYSPGSGPGAPAAGDRDKYRQHLGEAQRMQWLGEVAGLQESLRHITAKKQQA
ncbi:hypothetical protein [Streptomyces sp. NPDC101166]|uniref:hypothetical protein n=1 Tax=Streptomyces sp. NPDC101166 TaxID=3366120 RepID=UPI00380B1F41